MQSEDYQDLSKKFAKSKNKIEEGKTADFGFNVMTMQYGSMLEAGIIDPAKVTRSAIQNAVSVSSVLLTTEAVVANEKEEKAMGGGMPGGMMPGMM